jgi:hypothetical protein
MGRGVRSTVNAKSTPLRRKPVVLPDQKTVFQLVSWHHTDSGITAVPKVFHDWSALESPECAVDGELQNITGEKVGVYSRHFSLRTTRDGLKRLIVKNSDLRMDINSRGGGFGRAWAKELDERYRQLGATGVYVWATKLGSYIWADTGYVFYANEPYLPDNPEWPNSKELQAGVAHDIWHYPKIQNRLTELVRQGRITQTMVDDAGRRFVKLDNPFVHQDITNEKTIITPKDILDLGREQPWIDENKEVMWFGKEILITQGNQGGWEGYRDL